MLELINTASKRSCAACESARILNSMVSRDAQLDVRRTQTEKDALASKYSTLEQASLLDLSQASSVLRGVLNDTASLARVVGSNSTAQYARTLNTVIGNASLLSRLAGGIVSGVRTMGGRNGGTLSAIGSDLGILSAGLGADAVSLKDKVGAAPARVNTIESSALRPSNASPSLSGASSNTPHLMIMTSLEGQSYYFGLRTAAYDQLKRQSKYKVATQERLTRRNALQGVSQGGETITLSGVVFASLSGTGQLNALREIGLRVKPVLLTTGYGDSLGKWYLTSIDEEQEHLFADGLPRKQSFTLELERYGEDDSNV